MPLVWLIVVPVGAFFVAMGYVVASAGPVRPLALHLTLWCAGLAAVLWFLGLGWDALILPASVAATFVVVLVPAGFFNTARAWRERRELGGL